MCALTYSWSTANALLPSWITGRPPRPHLTNPLREKLPDDGSFWTPKIPDTQQSADLFHDLLSRCQSLQEIRDLVQRLEINLLQAPADSRRILKYMLNSNWEATELQDFILDRTLHAPGSGCFEDLLHWLTSKPHSEAHFKSFYVCVRKCLHLGLLSEREIEVLLAKLAKIEIVLQGIIMNFGDTELIQSWYWMMADAMRSCPIFSLNDLGEKRLQTWLFCVAEAPFALCALDTFRVLQQEFTTADGFGFKVNGARGLIKKWIGYAHGAVQRRLPSPNKAHDKPNLGYAKVADFLTGLQPPVAAKSICQITEKLVRDVLKGSRQPVALDIWMQTLSRLPRRSAGKILQDRSWRRRLGEEGSASRLSSRQGVVVRLWTATCLAAEPSKAHHLQELEELTQILVPLFGRQLKPSQNLLSEMIFTLQSLPLPSTSAVLQAVIKFSAGDLRIRGSMDKLQVNMVRVSKSRIALFEKDDIYKNAKVNLKPYLRQLAEQVNTDPEAFLQVAYYLIMRDKLSIKIITRILQHNLALNLSLAHAAVSTQMQVKEPHHTAQPTTTASPSLNQTVALNLMNSLACAFALSPVLTPRQSFRKVYWVYLHLHRFTWGIGITPEVTRALWHAGVTRHKETGTSPDKVRWILSKVRETEGQEVADRLLWFGAGSIRGWMDWIQKGSNGADTDGWKRFVGDRSKHMQAKEFNDKNGPC